MNYFRLILLLASISLPVHLWSQSIPEVTLTDGSGKAVQTRSLIDEETPFVVSLWMTTCKPCIKELDVLTDELADWDETFPLRIYAVSVDDSRSASRAIAMAHGSGWDGIIPLFDVNGDLKRALHVSAVPQVFVYDRHGKLFYTHIGYRPGDEANLLKQVIKAATVQ